MTNSEAAQKQASQKASDLFAEDLHEAVYDQTCRIIEQAEAEGFEYPYTLELDHDVSGHSLLSSCIAESGESVTHWGLRGVRQETLKEPLTISLWAENDPRAKLSRTFHIQDHYMMAAEIQGGGDTDNE